MLLTCSLISQLRYHHVLLPGQVGGGGVGWKKNETEALGGHYGVKLVVSDDGVERSSVP